MNAAPHPLDGVHVLCREESVDVAHADAALSRATRHARRIGQGVRRFASDRMLDGRTRLRAADQEASLAWISQADARHATLQLWETMACGDSLLTLSMGTGATLAPAAPADLEPLLVALLAALRRGEPSPPQPWLPVAAATLSGVGGVAIGHPTPWSGFSLHRPSDPARAIRCPATARLGAVAAPCLTVAIDHRAVDDDARGMTGIGLFATRQAAESPDAVTRLRALEELARAEGAR